ncbi:4-hydroxy-tetrahydrodipicolinate reductase [Mesoterricola sediminis]|uniref:4-hydroxy-tetrahydrodipicolinate reductase n=1 Tax=Mesoterricola sediminis TaxID=2927980 RepID=A0AA48GUB5_9BACT|nr:dihydrodipicolinate reductase C-terminal domain-containing protein [Mesoterricola sediminis]BDU75790.1 4-hydroxy-tetrahydrodipicolinate reductase [Mesoterricola sediminis]
MSAVRTTIGIFGQGRLGAAIAQAAAAAPDLEVVWTVDGPADPPPVDVALDASTAAAVPAHLEWALATGSGLVIGATGWELPDLAARVGDRIGVLTAPNFSLAVALMARLAKVLGRFAALDPELDPYLLDHHHRLKADAPSGTARRLAAALMEGCPRKTETTSGTAAPHQLSLAVLRAGAEFGTHTVGLDGPAETLTLTHQARSRLVFAQGALRAARWLKGRKGLHTFDACAAETLDPLFGDLS